MLKLNFEFYMRELQLYIHKSDLYTKDDSDWYGLETDPHVTLLYGLHEDVNIDMVRSSLAVTKFRRVKIHNVSLFENDEFDVLKFDVKDDIVNHCNKVLKSLPHTEQYGDYQPHMTIAYLKPGLGKKYVDRFKGNEYWVAPLYINYSDSNNTYSKIDINVI